MSDASDNSEISPRRFVLKTEMANNPPPEPGDPELHMTVESLPTSDA